MTLYHKQTGQGDALVLIPGWGFHHRVWDPVVHALSKDFTCWQMDLPGIGESEPWDSYDDDRLLEALAEILPNQVTLCGWSLGGMIALAFAERYPERVQRIITVATNPRFVQEHDWPGVPLELVEKFHQRLHENPRKTLHDFILLQCQGMPEARSWLKSWFDQEAASPMPDPKALEFGLSLLKEWDFRNFMKTLKIPHQHILGRLDALVPEIVSERLPHSAVFQRSAHMPFLTELEPFCEVIRHDETNLYFRN